MEFSKSDYLLKIKGIIINDLGINANEYISCFFDENEPYIEIKTSYVKYKIIIDRSDCGSRYTTENTKIIVIGSSFLEQEDKVKFFLRRQFIADEELFNLYLKRGKEINPHEAQHVALLNLENTRKSGNNKALAVLATGLGKTILSALDVKNTKSDKVLFIVHIDEILKQTKESFEMVMPERKNDMGFFTGKQKDRDKKILFASIQTIGRQKHIESFSPNHFDYIIIDETHHTAAPTYKKIFDYFHPNFFLGLTATPDRMDKKDILNFYDHNVVFEMNQEDAIEQGYLTPFQYLGFKDNINYSNIFFNGFKYDIKDLNKHLLIDARDNEIIKKYKESAGNRKTIGFCASIEHAERCAKKFNEAGIDAISIHSKSVGLDGFNEKGVKTLINHFRQNKCQIVFVVDMFNEGIDIPDVSCLLFLRPTESKTVFVQHMGRGLRISPGKENVLILDFIGNYRTANLIIEGLNLKNNIRDLKKSKREGKDVFAYSINNCEIIFESEVIDIFKNNEAAYSEEIKNEFISKEWIEYSTYLNKWTKDNLYWKRGQQNQYFEVNLEAIRVIKDNPKITEKDFIEKIQEIVKEKYPGKNMTAGFRGLMLSKISGFISANTPLKPMEPFMKICEKTKDFKNIELYRDVLTSQLEKILYWNPIYGSYNKYVDLSHRVSFNDFKVYPFFFIYDVLISLIDDYGETEPFVSRFEFNTFMAITKEHSESKDVLERILRFRKDEEIHQTKKLLDKNNNIDPRFYGIVHYNKYIEKTKIGIKIKDKYVDEVREKVKKFKELYNSGKLIFYKENDQELYENMLYSNQDLINYCTEK